MTIKTLTNKEVIKLFLDFPDIRLKPFNTKKAYLNDLKGLVDYLDRHEISLMGLNDMVVQDYLDRMVKKDGKPVSTATRQRTLATISTFCQKTEQDNVVKDIDIPKTPHITKQTPKGLAKDEVTTLRRRISTSHSVSKLRDQAILDLLVYSGFRVSELVSLNRSDIFYNKGTYIITIHQTKNKEERSAYFDHKKFRYIKRYLDSREDTLEPFFISSRNQRISIRMVQTILKKYDIHPHLLRHTFCSTLARNKVDLFSLAKLSGHKDINVLKRYCEPTADELAEMVSKSFD